MALITKGENLIFTTKGALTAKGGKALAAKRGKALTAQVGRLSLQKEGRDQ